jgi:hypothetical protein
MGIRSSTFREEFIDLHFVRPVHSLQLVAGGTSFWFYLDSLPRTNYSAFWWIAGDALGFRRASGISPSTNQPFKFTTALQFDNVLQYDKQLELFCSKGFAIWDVLNPVNARDR